MKSGNAEIDLAGQRILEHLVRYRLVTKPIWEAWQKLDPSGATDYSKAIKRLIKNRFVDCFSLHHGRFYFVLTERANRELNLSECGCGPLSEYEKVKAYARLAYCSQTKSVELMTPPEVRVLISEECVSWSKGFYRIQSSPERVGFMRVDGNLQSHPARAAQQLRTDVFRFGKAPCIVKLIKSNRFELTWLTATEMRMSTVIELFRSYDKVGNAPINSVVLPALLPLLTSIPLDGGMKSPL
jgi:hypothetical protein